MGVGLGEISSRFRDEGFALHELIASRWRTERQRHQTEILFSLAWQPQVIQPLYAWTKQVRRQIVTNAQLITARSEVDRTSGHPYEESATDCIKRQ